MKLMTVLATLIVSNFVCAADSQVIWKQIDTHFSYQHSARECSTKTSVGNSHIPGEAYLAMEIDDGKVVAAKFSNYPNIWPYTNILKTIELTNTELQSIELYQDKKKNYWVKAITLSERLLKWLVHFPSLRHHWCEIPFVPKTLTPNKVRLVFETDGFEHGVFISYSEWMKLNGTDLESNSFSESLRLVQKNYKSEGL